MSHTPHTHARTHAHRMGQNPISQHAITIYLPSLGPVFTFFSPLVGKKLATIKIPLVPLCEGHIFRECGATYTSQRGCCRNTAISFNINPCSLINSADSKSGAVEYSLGAPYTTNYRCSQRQIGYTSLSSRPSFVEYPICMAHWLQRTCLLWFASLSQGCYSMHGLS